MFPIKGFVAKVIPLNTAVKSSDVWRMAESYGCKCYIDLESSVTHLIAAKAGTGKVTKVLNSPNIYLVNPSWFYESVKFWKKADEYLYPVDNLPVHNNTNNIYHERPSKKSKNRRYECDGF